MDRESFVELIQDDTTLVIGTIAAISYLETRNEAHGPGGIFGATDWEFYHVKVQIQRQYFGPEISTKGISVHNVRLAPMYPPGGFNTGRRRRYLVNDLVVMRVRSLEDGSYESLNMYHIEADEIDRLARVTQLLSIDQQDEQARQVLTGCFDQDPYYALWCLDVVKDWHTDDPFDLRREQYFNIRKHLTYNQIQDIYAKLFTAETTHPLVWIHIDHRLASKEDSRSSNSESENAQWNELRHQQHLKRIPKLTRDSALEVPATYQDEELIYLFDPDTHQRTAKQWAEMVALLDRCYSKNPKHPTITTMLRAVAYIFDPADKQLRDSVFAFYTRHIPHELNGDDRNRYYGIGLVRVMRDESEYTDTLCQQGLDLLLADLAKADKQQGHKIVAWLADYAQFCVVCDIEAKRLSQILQDVAVVTADDEIQADINEMLVNLKLVPAKPAGTAF